MPYPIQWILSLIFVIQMYLAMAVLAIVFTPLAILKRDYAYLACRTYCHWVRLSARFLVGLKSEIRGDVPTDEVLIGAKHQSFFDIILIVSAVPRPKFIMKKQLVWTPIVGYYAKRIGCVAVDRGKRGQAIKKMIADVKSGASLPGQLIIFPQGTRVAAGAHLPYKIGTGVLYEQTEQPLVPAATNVGVFWPRHGVYRKPGLAVVEFLPRIEAGREMKEVMAELETTVETASDRLMAEAGFEGPVKTSQISDLVALDGGHDEIRHRHLHPRSPLRHTGSCRHRQDRASHDAGVSCLAGPLPLLHPLHRGS